MKNSVFSVSVLALVIVILGCASKKPASSSTQSYRYSEDLSVWRPIVNTRVDTSHAPIKTNTNKQTVALPPKLTVNDQLETVLDSIDQINLMKRSIDGFTIQVFAGDKEGALQAKKELAMAIPELSSELTFVTPTFRVKVGQYYTRMEAQKDFMTVKRYFPNAIVIPEKIMIN